MRFTITTILIALLTSSITPILASPLEETAQLGALSDANDAAEFPSFEAMDQEADLKPAKAAKAALKKAGAEIADAGKTVVRAVKKLGPAPNRQEEGPTDYRD